MRRAETEACGFPIGSFFDGKGRDRKEKDKIEGSGSEAPGASETEVFRRLAAAVLVAESWKK